MENRNDSRHINGQIRDFFCNVHIKEIKQHKELIAELRIWCQNNNSIPKNITDHQLIEFLNATSFQLKDTKELLLNHYEIKNKLADLLFNDRDPLNEKFQGVWSVIRLLTLPKPTKEGCLLVYCSLLNTDPKAFNIVTSFRLLTMAIETSLICDGLFDGYSVIGDAFGMSFNHFPLSALSLIKKLLIYVQCGLPIKVQAIHVLNLSKIGEKIYQFIRPLLGKDLARIIHIHKGDSILSLHRIVSKDLLPEELGGNLGPVIKYQNLFRKKVEFLKEWFALEESQRNEGIVENVAAKRETKLRKGKGKRCKGEDGKK